MKFSLSSLKRSRTGLSPTIRRLLAGGAIATTGTLWQACGSDPTCEEGGSCFDAGAGDGTSGDAPVVSDDATSDVRFSGGDSTAVGCTGADGSACAAGYVCQEGQCRPAQGGCASNENCQYDTYCDPVSKTCVPYSTTKPNDTTCAQLTAAGILQPTIRCEFSTPPNGDPFPLYTDVQGSPMVVNFNANGAGSPSIVVPFTQPLNDNYREFGIVRILKGNDCTLEANIGGVDLDADTAVDWVNSPSSVALGDLDGDKIADIVVLMYDGSVIAFSRKTGAWAPLWPGVKSKNGVAIYRFMPAGNFNTAARSNYWASPSIHDLDDDGLPEIVVEGAVLNGQTGALRSANPVGYTQVNLGTHPVLANLDQDARIELTNGRAIWEFDGATNQWIADGTYNAVSTAAAWTAVADFNPYDNLKKPEIVARDNFGLSIYSTDHTLFLGTRAVIPGGGGGAPTIADFDGDGLPEVGVAGSDYYTVFDPDCQAVPRTGGLCDRTTPKCEHVPGTNLCPNFMLWSRKTQDHSSNITGSTVFDFEADGKAEVVYGDECFTRVYSGSSGKVLFSQYRSSCTWLEYPIVADVDGNLRADLVVPSNTACGPAGVGIACEGLDANGVDAQFAGLICEKNTDCQSGTCDQGLCRCTTSSQCCGEKDDAKCNDFGYKCAPPPVGTPGTGNTCRASHPKGLSGIRVYRDAADRWVRSRSIWNQHAYAVTHVNEDGTVPKTSVWANNWTTAGLNNFRQNVPGTRDARALGDVTAQVAGYTCSSGNATLSIPICNRGAAPVGKGVPVGFYSGNTKVCSAVTMNTLDIGKCETVSCIWENAPSDAAPVDVIVKANDGAGSAECYSSNNNGSIPRVGCKALQ